jgi:undecaprenyl-diphosphatase
MKFIFERPRPFNINIIIENGYSFPSGHSMVSLAFYGLFIYIIWHMNKPRLEKLFYVIPLILLVLLIGISRIYLGVHYASDVIAGYALSMAYLIIFIKLFYKKMKS